MLGVAILVHKRLFSFTKWELLSGSKLQLALRNKLEDLLQMWSLTRTPGDSAINHILRLEHYKGQGRQPLDSRSELMKRETENVPASAVVLKLSMALKIASIFLRLRPILFQGRSAFCLTLLTLTWTTVLGKRTVPIARRVRTGMCLFGIRSWDPGGNLISGSSAFSKTGLNIRKFTVHILLKPGLENFEHYFY